MTLRGYDPLRLMINAVLLGAPCNRNLLDTVAQKTGVTARLLYGRLWHIKKRFADYSPQPEQELIGQLDLYNFLLYLAHRLADELRLH